MENTDYLATGFYLARGFKWDSSEQLQAIIERESASRHTPDVIGRMVDVLVVLRKKILMNPGLLFTADDSIKRPSNDWRGRLSEN